MKYDREIEAVHRMRDLFSDVPQRRLARRLKDGTYLQSEYVMIPEDRMLASRAQGAPEATNYWRIRMYDKARKMALEAAGG